MAASVNCGLKINQTISIGKHFSAGSLIEMSEETLKNHPEEMEKLIKMAQKDKNTMLAMAAAVVVAGIIFGGYELYKRYSNRQLPPANRKAIC